MYTFIRQNGGWWLKISSVDEYINAKVFENPVWNEAANQLGDPKRGRTKHFTNPIAQLIFEFRSKRTGNGILRETAFLIDEVSSKQLEFIEKYGAIYINRMGGYCFGFDETERITKEELIFPDDDYTDISIKKWPYGSHYYLYINGRQIHDEFGNIKWNTYERAKEIAKSYLQSLKCTCSLSEKE